MSIECPAACAGLTLRCTAPGRATKGETRSNAKLGQPSCSTASRRKSPATLRTFGELWSPPCEWNRVLDGLR